MRKKNKQVKAYSLGGIILLLAIVALIAALVITGAVKLPKDCGGKTSVSKAYNAQSGGIFDGIDVSTTEESYYYLDIPMAGQKLLCSSAHGQKDWILHSDFKGEWFKRKDVEVTLLFRFRGVTVDGENIYCMASGVVINIPAWCSMGHEIKFPNDVFINLRESYYKELKAQEANLSKVSVMILYSGGAVPLGISQFECQYGAVTGEALDVGFKLDGITVSEETELRPGDNGLGDNGGMSSTNRGFWDYLKQWYDHLPVWGKVLVWVGVAVVILGIISLFTGLFVKR